MTRIEELRKNIQYFDNMSNHWHNMRIEAEAELAPLLSPFKPGDIISHGDKRGYQSGNWIVDGAEMRNGSLVVVATKLKKNGARGILQSGILYPKEFKVVKGNE